MIPLALKIQLAAAGTAAAAGSGGGFGSFFGFYHKDWPNPSADPGLGFRIKYDEHRDRWVYLTVEEDTYYRSNTANPQITGGTTFSAFELDSTGRLDLINSFGYPIRYTGTRMNSCPYDVSFTGENTGFSMVGGYVESQQYTGGRWSVNASTNFGTTRFDNTPFRDAGTPGFPGVGSQNNYGLFSYSAASNIAFGFIEGSGNSIISMWDSSTTVRSPWMYLGTATGRDSRAWGQFSTLRGFSGFTVRAINYATDSANNVYWLLQNESTTDENGNTMPQCVHVVRFPARLNGDNEHRHDMHKRYYIEPTEDSGNYQALTARDICVDADDNVHVWVSTSGGTGFTQPSGWTGSQHMMFQVTQGKSSQDWLTLTNPSDTYNFSNDTWTDATFGGLEPDGYTISGHPNNSLSTTVRWPNQLTNRTRRFTVSALGSTNSPGSANATNFGRFFYDVSSRRYIFGDRLNTHSSAGLRNRINSWDGVGDLTYSMRFAAATSSDEQSANNCTAYVTNNDIWFRMQPESSTSQGRSDYFALLRPNGASPFSETIRHDNGNGDRQRLNITSTPGDYGSVTNVEITVDDWASYWRIYYNDEGEDRTSINSWANAFSIERSVRGRYLTEPRHGYADDRGRARGVTETLQGVSGSTAVGSGWNSTINADGSYVSLAHRMIIPVPEITDGHTGGSLNIGFNVPVNANVSYSANYNIQVGDTREDVRDNLATNLQTNITALSQSHVVTTEGNNIIVTFTHPARVTGLSNRFVLSGTTTERDDQILFDYDNYSTQLS